jgi:DNA repair protein RadC
MNNLKQPSSAILQKPFEPTKEELKTQFRAKVLEQIPIAQIKLQYHKEVAPKDRLKILSSKQVPEILRALWNYDTLELQESFKILYLNNYNQIIGLYPHSQGSINGTLVDIRLILAAALQCGAVGMIIAHNHPSSNTNPSESDKQLTKKIKQATVVMDINLLDHIILTKDDYYSFADDGQL